MVKLKQCRFSTRTLWRNRNLIKISLTIVTSDSWSKEACHYGSAQMKLSASLNSSRIFSFESMLTRIFISVVQIHRDFLNKVIFGLLVSPLLNAVKIQENITASCKRLSPDFLVGFLAKNYFKKTVKLAFHVFRFVFSTKTCRQMLESLNFSITPGLNCFLKTWICCKSASFF